MADRFLTNLIFYVILVCFLTISTYATYHGLLPSLQLLAKPATAGIVLTLAGCTMAIHFLRRKTNASIIGPLFVLALALFVSTASNVTFIYTNYLEADLVRE